MTTTMARLGGVLAGALLLVACGEAPAPSIDRGPGDARASSVPLTGEVITVEMHGIGAQYFEPADFTARRGDVIQFKLVSGVHNASWPADRNPAGVRLPDATPYLQAPGQTHEVVVDLPPGEYEYVCDPHIALGMVGTMTVVD
jgi:plastocyanin